MRQLQYRDNSPTREIEEDWGATGNEEMNELHAEVTQKASIVDVRDRLNCIYSLVEVCRFALESSKDYHQAKVAEVLSDYISPEIKKAEEELRHV